MKSPKVKAVAKNLDELLESLANATCPSGCKCIFCRTFEYGVEAGKQDAAIAFGRALDEFKQKAGIA